MQLPKTSLYIKEKKIKICFFKIQKNKQSKNALPNKKQTLNKKQKSLITDNQKMNKLEK